MRNAESRLSLSAAQISPGSGVEEISMSKFACFVAILALAGTGAIAQSASSKATAAINSAVYCTLDTSSVGSISGIETVNTCQDLYTGQAITATPDNFIPIMTTSIKVSNSQSLFVTPSLVTGLYTNTAVKTHSGSSGSTSSAVAEGGVYLRAIITNVSTGAVQIADPIAICSNDILGCQQSSSGDWGVMLDQRIQTLSQTLSACGVTIGGVTAGTCSFDLTTQLILQTTSAHSFGFIFPNVGVGTYNISIQAAVNANADTGGSAYAAGAAAFGLGSVTVESVRLVHNFSF